MIIPVIVLLCTISLLTRESFEFDYCKLNCEHQKHAACVKNGICHPINCDQRRGTYIWRELFLRHHNLHRNNVALGNESAGFNTMASNMMALSYDMELEYLANCWASKYIHDYDQCRKTRKYDFGQNIYKGYRLRRKLKVENVIKAWYAQVKNLPEGLLESFRENDVMYRRYRHFTQLVNAETTLVGCGSAVDFADENIMIICNYAPAGNVINKPVYKRGPPASECPNGTKPNKKYIGLCGEDNMPPAAKRQGPVKTASSLSRISREVALFLSFTILSIK